MPKRRNLFQETVRIIYEQMVDGSRVSESAMLLDRETGHRREVDVVISSEIADQQIIVCVEATARGRRADVAWVEGMVAKHRSLPTNKLILIAEAGFTGAARSKAVSHGVVPLEPEELSEVELSRTILGGLRSLWPRVVMMLPLRARILTTGRGGRRMVIQAHADTVLTASDGTELGVLQRGLTQIFSEHFAAITRDIGVFEAEFSKEDTFKLILGPGWLAGELADGDREVEKLLACVRTGPNEDGELEYLPIEGMLVSGRLRIDVTEFALRHWSLGDIKVSIGTATSESGSFLVISERLSDPPRVTLRFTEHEGSMDGDAVAQDLSEAKNDYWDAEDAEVRPEEVGSIFKALDPDWT
jgi:hypothetical protein